MFREGPMRTRNAVLIGTLAFSLLRLARSRRTYSFRGKTVVITGGSRGLGLVLARAFIQEGARVAVLARDEAELQVAETDLRGRGGDSLAVICDVTDQKQVEYAINEVAEHFQRIDLLVNNAGIIQTGPMENMVLRDYEQAMAVHFYGPLYSTIAALPHIEKQGGGRIINIASIGGKIAFPHLLPYSASKFALVGFSDGLRAELRRKNIYVTTVCPGLMRTGSPRNASFKGQHRKEYAWFAIADSLPLLSIRAERAAHKIINASRRGVGRLIVGWQTKAAVLAAEILPETTADILASVNRLLPGPDLERGTASHKGEESESAWAPSVLTRATEAAALRNNEVRGT